MTPTYRYNTLRDPKKQIRLLYLHVPAEGNDAAPVRGSLVNIEHALAPDYITLSYTWGNEEATEILFLCACNESQEDKTGCNTIGSLLITPNLTSALRRISANSYHRQNRPIWVDAVCINQSDHDEKGHQVHRMGSIYSLAASLHGEICPKHGHDEFQERAYVYKHCWRAVSFILSHAWFRRRWIIQEVVLGPSKYLLWGSYGMCWHRFVLIARELQNLEIFKHDLGEYRFKDDRYGMELLLALDMVQGLMERRRDLAKTTAAILWDDQSLGDRSNYEECKDSTKDVVLSLETLLEMFSTAQVSDHRDAIYSLVALAPEINGDSWLPNYSPENTTANVFVEALQHIVATNQNLDVLCRSVIFRPGSVIPPLPEYSTSLSPLVCSTCAYCGHRNKSLANFGSPIWKSSATVYRASGQMSPYCMVSAPATQCSTRFEPRIQVEVLGYRIDLIREIDEGDSATLTLHERLGVSKSMLRMVLRHSRDHCSISNDEPAQRSVLERNVPDAFWRSLCGNRSQGVGYAENHLVTEMPARWTSMMQNAYITAMATKLTKCNEEGTDVPQSVEDENGPIEEIEEEGWSDIDSIIDAEEGEEWERINKTATTIKQQRMFALTDSSMGFVPDVAQVRMPIYILQGCSVPVVLRQCSDCHEANTYNLVGDCYIDGVMEGELVDRIRDMVPEKIILH